VDLVRGKSRGDEGDQPLGEKLAEDDEKKHPDPHDGGDSGERPIPILLPPFRDVAGEDRNEGDRESSAGQQVVQKVGNGEGGEIGVGFRGRPVLVGDHRVPRVPEDAA
jgi:hypothetical protein